MNPFRDWKPEQQHIGWWGCTSDNKDIGWSSPQAVKWCADGWLKKMETPFSLRKAFDDWLYVNRSTDTMAANDGLHWTPAQFAAAWDEFEAGKGKA